MSKVPKVVQLTIKNFMKLRDVKLQLGKVNQFVGETDNGKTAVIKAIKFAAKGKNGPSIITTGEDKTEVILELEDGVLIDRSMNQEGKQRLKIRREGGGGQAFLNTLFKSEVFNPLELLNPKNRTDTILEAISFKVTADEVAEHLKISKEKLPDGIDYQDHGLKVIDNIYDYFFKRRAEAKKERDEKQERVELHEKATPRLEGVDKTLTPEAHAKNLAEIQQKIAVLQIEVENEETLAGEIKELEQQKKESSELLARNERAKLDLEVEIKKVGEDHKYATGMRKQRYQSDLERLQTEFERDLREIDKKAVTDAERLSERKEKYVEAVINGADKIELIDKKIQQFEPTTLPELKEQMAALNVELEKATSQSKDLELIGIYKKHMLRLEELRREAQAEQSRVDELEDRLNKLLGEVRQSLMAKIQMPVPGLEYLNGKFTLDGYALDDLSTSQMIRLAVAIIKNLSGETKLICIDGAESLDEKAYRTLHEEIEKDDFVYVLTRVGEPLPAGDGDKIFNVSDGEISEVQ